MGKLAWCVCWCRKTPHPCEWHWELQMKVSNPPPRPPNPKPQTKRTTKNDETSKKNKYTFHLPVWCISPGVDEVSAYSNTSSILFSDHSVLLQLNSACGRQETRNICFHWYFIPILWTVLLTFICFNFIFKKKKPNKVVYLGFCRSVCLQNLCVAKFDLASVP